MPDFDFMEMIWNTLQTQICVIFLLICRRTEKAWNLISQAKICLICGRNRRWNTTFPNLSPIKKLKNWTLKHESVNEMNFQHRNFPITNRNSIIGKYAKIFSFFPYLPVFNLFAILYSFIPTFHTTEKPRKPYGSGVSYAWTQCTLRYSIFYSN